jgi:hypothetical protein
MASCNTQQHKEEAQQHTPMHQVPKYRVPLENFTLQNSAASIALGSSIEELSVAEWRQTILIFKLKK